MKALVLMLILLSSFASAELIVNTHTNDFTLSSENNEQLKLCSCETRVDTLLVENIGDFATQVTIEVESDYENVRLADDTVTLAPKHSSTILVYIDDTCGKTGEYTYVIRASNDYGREEILERTIRIDACASARLHVSEGESIGLCEDAEFEVTVTNTGRNADTFWMSFGQDEPDAVDELWLKPGDSFEQDISFSWPCDEYGTKSIEFFLSSDKTGQMAHTSRDVEIRNEFDFTLETLNAVTVCADAKAQIPVLLENSIDIPDEIRVEISGPAFASFDGARAQDITLADNQTVPIEIAPGRSVIGEHTLTVTASDDHGNEEKRDVSVTVEDCFNAAVFIADPQSKVVGYDRDCCGEKEYVVSIANTADREQEFVLSLDGPEFFTLAESTVSVQPGQTVTVPLSADLPCADESYEVWVSATPKGQEITFRGSLTVDSLSERSCSMIEIEDDEIVSRAGEIPVNVKNTGLRGGMYAVETNDTTFVVQEDELTVEAGEQGTITLVPQGDVSLGRYVVTASFKQDGLTYNEDIGVRVRAPTMGEKASEWCSSLTDCGRLAFWLSIALLVLLILLVFIWLGLTLFGSGLSGSLLSILKTLIVLAIILCVIWLLFIPIPGSEVHPDALAWPVDESLTVNMDAYFEDPDLDILSYDVDAPDGVTADVDGSEITLTAEETGEFEMVASASDDRGGEVSADFILQVLPPEPKTLQGRIGIWCKHIVVLLLIAILIVLFLILLTIKERRQDLRTENVLVVVPKKALKKRRKTRYYSSKTGTKAHMRSCMALKKVTASERVVHKSKASVLNAGLALCSMCTKAESKNPTARMKKREEAATSSPKIRTKGSGKAVTRRTSKPVKKVKAVVVGKPKRSPARSAKKKAAKKDQTVNIQVNIGQK